MMPFYSQPIDFAGVHFQSTTEAAWAVLLDSAGISWRYEPWRFHFSKSLARMPGSSPISYLPDFYLPDLKAFFEVKPGNPMASELLKAMMVAEYSGLPVIMTRGCVADDDSVVVVKGFDQAANYGFHDASSRKCGLFAINSDLVVASPRFHTKMWKFQHSLGASVTMIERNYRLAGRLPNRKRIPSIHFIAKGEAEPDLMYRQDRLRVVEPKASEFGLDRILYSVWGRDERDQIYAAEKRRNQRDRLLASDISRWERPGAAIARTELGQASQTA